MKKVWTKNYSKHLQWIHDRIINVYGEDKDVDFLIKLREIIQHTKSSEDSFNVYMGFVEKYKLSDDEESVD